MPEYIVQKPCRPDGRVHRTEGEVTLTEAQAKYLLLSGHIVPKGKGKKAATTKTIGKRT